MVKPHVKRVVAVGSTGLGTHREFLFCKDWTLSLPPHHNARLFHSPAPSSHPSVLQAL